MPTSRPFNTSSNPLVCPLNYRLRLFVVAYLGESSRSAVDAARRAGYSHPEKQGPRLAEKRQVKAAIDAGEATAAMPADEVLARATDVASADMRHFVAVDDRGGCRVDMKRVCRLGLAHVIRRVRTSKDGTVDIELEPKAPALVKLGEHYKLWKGEAEPQLTLVDLAKGLKERYEKWNIDNPDD